MLRVRKKNGINDIHDIYPSAVLDHNSFCHYSLRMILERITSDIYWVLIGVLVLNLFQRKHIATGQRKRMATLFFALLILLSNVLFAVILSTGMPQWTAFIAVAIAVFVGYAIRTKLLVFKFKCPSCGARLDTTSLLFHDSNLCVSCRDERSPAPAAVEEEILAEPSLAEDVNDIDWDLWDPEETAVLCYIFKNKQVLLINKKTGLGKGLINAPGGRIEETETALEAAVRETEEETGLTPTDLTHAGILNFQFTDGYSLRGHVFTAKDCTGELKKTSEADPFWIPIEKIPYDMMWEDDRHWLPMVMDGQFIEGRFIFDGKKMVSKELSVRS